MAKVVGKLSCVELLTRNVLETSQNFVAGETLSVGTPVIMSDDGSVLKPAPTPDTFTWDSEYLFNPWPSGKVKVRGATGSNTVAILYNEGNYDLWYVRGGTVSGGVLTTGTAVAAYPGNTLDSGNDMVYLYSSGADHNYAILYSRNNEPGDTVSLGFMTVNGTTVTINPAQQISVEFSFSLKVDYDPTNQRIICFWRSSSDVKTVVASESAGVFTFGAINTTATDFQGDPAMVAVRGLNTFVINTRYSSYAATYNASTLAITMGAGVSNGGSNVSKHITYDYNSNTVISIWDSSGWGYSVFTISGNVLTFQNTASMPGDHRPQEIIWNPNQSSVQSIGTTGSPANLEFTEFSVDGSYNLSLTTPVVHSTFQNIYDSSVGISDTDKILLVVGSDAVSANRQYTVLNSASHNFSREHIIGVTNSDASIGESIEVTTVGNINNKQSGLVPGSKYYTDLSGVVTPTATDNIFIGMAKSTTELYVGTGTAVASGPLFLSQYKVAHMPTAADATGGLIYVSDESGGGTLAYSNGLNWLRVYDNVIVT